MAHSWVLVNCMTLSPFRLPGSSGSGSKLRSSIVRWGDSVWVQWSESYGNCHLSDRSCMTGSSLRCSVDTIYSVQISLSTSQPPASLFFLFVMWNRIMWFPPTHSCTLGCCYLLLCCLVSCTPSFLSLFGTWTVSIFYLWLFARALFLYFYLTLLDNTLPHLLNPYQPWL